MSVDIKNKSKISINGIKDKAPDKLGLHVIAGKENLMNNFVNSERIQKLGLAFAGYNRYLQKGCVQVIGQSEISYLSQLDIKAKSHSIENFDLTNVYCVLVTNNLDLPRKLLNKLKSNKVPVLLTSLRSTEAISSLSRFLQNTLAPNRTIHGVMLGMYGLGILILGKSGIGKSECALDLVRFGHSLISDDSVIVKKIGDKLEGSSPKLSFEHIEVRGLGIINIKDLYGVSAIGQSAKINLCIELKNWNEVKNIDRLGLSMQEEEIIDIKVPKFVLPVSSGRNVSTLVETAVRAHLLKLTGHDTSQTLIAKHNIAVGN